jgi:hypothetical protein
MQRCATLSQGYHSAFSSQCLPAPRSTACSLSPVEGPLSSPVECFQGRASDVFYPVIPVLGSDNFVFPAAQDRAVSNTPCAVVGNGDFDSVFKMHPELDRESAPSRPLSPSLGYFHSLLIHVPASIHIHSVHSQPSSQKDAAKTETVSCHFSAQEMEATFLGVRGSKMPRWPPGPQ